MRQVDNADLWHDRIHHATADRHRIVHHAKISHKHNRLRIFSGLHGGTRSRNKHYCNHYSQKGLAWNFAAAIPALEYPNHASVLLGRLSFVALQEYWGLPLTANPVPPIY